jgi:hypothetical protein
MFDVYIGAPYILASMIGRVGRSASFLDATKLAYVDLIHGQQPIRQYVENRNDELFRDQLLGSSASQSLRQLFGCSQALVSYPDLLGHVRDIVGRRPFRLMDRRVSRLDDLLESREMTLHLMIVSPVDLVMSHSDLPLQTRLKLIAETKLSWANIAWRILRAAPKRSLVVWNCERPRAVAEAFFEMILQKSSFFSEGRTIELPVDSEVHKMDSPCTWMEGIEDNVMQLDEQFEIDLQKIEEMPRANLQSF